jgi:hypothetical protein
MHPIVSNLTKTAELTSGVSLGGAVEELLEAGGGVRAEADLLQYADPLAAFGARPHHLLDMDVVEREFVQVSGLP